MQPEKFSKQEQEILKVLSATVKNKRIQLEKSQRLFSAEYDIQKSMISRFENCKNEPKLFSLWRIANAFDMKLSELIKLIEDELPKDIKFIEE